MSVCSNELECVAFASSRNFTRGRPRVKFLDRPRVKFLDRPRVKFLDDANATHSSSFEHTLTPVLCRPYASPSFAKLRAIEYLFPTKRRSNAFVSPNSDCICTESNLHVFCSKRYMGSVSISIETKREEQDSNSFSTSGTSQQRLHLTCLHFRQNATESCPYEGREMDLVKYIKLKLSVCSVCVFAIRGHVFCPFATEIGTHTRYA